MLDGNCRNVSCPYVGQWAEWHTLLSYAPNCQNSRKYIVHKYMYIRWLPGSNILIISVGIFNRFVTICAYALTEEAAKSAVSTLVTVSRDLSGNDATNFRFRKVKCRYPFKMCSLDYSRYVGTCPGLSMQPWHFDCIFFESHTRRFSPAQLATLVWVWLSSAEPLALTRCQNWKLNNSQSLRDSSHSDTAVHVWVCFSRISPNFAWIVSSRVHTTRFRTVRDRSQMVRGRLPVSTREKPVSR